MERDSICPQKSFENGRLSEKLEIEKGRGFLNKRSAWH
jgi:hypothetical protein